MTALYDAAYRAKMRAMLLHYFGTTDPDLLAELWERRAKRDDAERVVDEKLAKLRADFVWHDEHDWQDATIARAKDYIAALEVRAGVRAEDDSEADVTGIIQSRVPDGIQLGMIRRHSSQAKHQRGLEIETDMVEPFEQLGVVRVNGVAYAPAPEVQA